MQLSSSILNSIFFKTIFAVLFLVMYQPSASLAQVMVGAESTAEYVPVLQGKKIALVVNQTSLVGSKHLADTLINLGIQIKKIFAPEHGFRGDADAGETVSGSVDEKTNIPIVSIYGDKLKPTAEDLTGIDIVVYDIQDVGVRFFTYVSTLHYVVEACAENDVPLLVLDRPDPNGYYVDGPVLKPDYASFVGMDPVPIVYGLTPAEYANMLIGEQWLSTKKNCRYTYVLCKGYDHNTFYSLPVNPSPNLRSMNAIHLYPSICLLEGTPVSVGRGTDRPFSIIGYPGFTKGNAGFNPKSMPGAKNPPYLNQTCKGYDLTGLATGFFKENPRLMLHWVADFYLSYPEKEKFFSSFFDKLAGTDELQKQFVKGTPEMEIRRSWEPALTEYKVKRKKYLLYPDFEE